VVQTRARVALGTGGDGATARILQESRLSTREVHLATHHYSFGKRMRELAKKQKQEEKRLRKETKKQTPAPDEAPAPAGE
jgi:hypothetical protein